MTRRSRAALLAAALGGLVLGGGTLATSSPAFAAQRPGPSAGEVAAGKATVAQREQQVAHAAAALGRAKAHFDKLSEAAEGVVEAYDEAESKLQSAQRSADTARSVLALADNQVAQGKQAAALLARSAYESGGVSAIDVFLTPGGTRSLIDRVGDIAAIGLSQHQTLTRLDAASIYRAAVAKQTAAVAAGAREAATQAARAKSAAEAAALHQQKVLAALHRQKAHLAELLTEAQANASRLQKQRIAALAAEQTASAVSASSPSSGGPSPYVGTTGDLSGTISAATGEAAVREAEAQIGKPYQWGGAGPNSFDCSGLVMWAYDQVGVHLQHWTGFQWTEGAHVATSDLRPGDLLFFAYNTSEPSTIHHVAMYIGNGQMVQAPYTGADVEISNDDSVAGYIGAVRPYQQ